MSKTVDFIFDFASPNAYLSYQMIQDICQRTDAQLNIVPALLGGIFKLTNNKPPMVAFDGVKGKLQYQRTEMTRFIKKNGISAFRMNPHFPVNTLTLMRGAMVAERDGYLDSYVTAGLTAMWEAEKKMDDQSVFVTAMNDAGFDGQRILDATAEESVKEALLVNTQSVVARGVFGIPTFFVGEEMFFGKDRLNQVEEEILAD